MKKLKLYLETSVISSAIDNREPDKTAQTLRLLDEIKEKGHEAFVSRIVLVEIAKADENTQKKLLAVLQDIDPEELNIDKEAEALSGKYISEGVIPQKYENDALHIAVASVNGLDAVVSWNFSHMVNHKTRMEVMGINTFMGYRVIDICTPKEVAKDVSEI